MIGIGMTDERLNSQPATVAVVEKTRLLNSIASAWEIESIIML